MTQSIAIVYHSGYGHTGKVAEAVAEGAKQQGATVTLIKADTIADADWDTLDKADAIIFGAPTYMGSLSGPFKIFMDATSRKWGEQKWKDKIAGGFTNSASYSGDKLNSLQQLVTLAMQHGMIWVGQAERAPQFEDGGMPTQDILNRLGSWTGLMTQANHKQGADTAPGEGDIETAKRFGQRIAEMTTRLKN
ncbi:MAG TPA: flavodoxin family protein [Alphaproteobacteria bacterium]